MEAADADMRVMRSRWLGMDSGCDMHDSTGSSTVGWLCCFAIGLALTPTYTEQRHLVGDGKVGFCALATFVEPIASSLNIGVYASLTEVHFLTERFFALHCLYIWSDM